MALQEFCLELDPIPYQWNVRTGPSVRGAVEVEQRRSANGRDGAQFMSAREPQLGRAVARRSHQYPAKAVILCRARVLRGVHGGEWAGTELDFSLSSK
jgi:hypothetical protein